MGKEKFSYFLPPIWNTDPEKDPLSLEEVWSYISGKETLWVFKGGERDNLINTGTLQEVTDRVRSLPPEVYGDRRKGKVTSLPLVTFGGVFSKREGAGLQETSGLVHLDIDHISGLPGVSLERLKESLSKDREIGLRLIFTSPSGDGLKLVCKTSGEITDPESYRREFETLNYFVSQKYSIPIGSIGLDRGISDISRGCLLCFDYSSVLQDWEDTFHPESHPLPKVEVQRPRREAPRAGEEVTPWDWNSFEEETLIPALFERVPEAFPDMDFRWRGDSWESPRKLDGSSPKIHRTEKTIISTKYPGIVLEQGGDRVPIVKYYQERNSLQYGEALRELSQICGVEEEYKDLSRRYAKQMNKQETNTRQKPSEGAGNPSSLRAVAEPPSQTPTEAELEEKYKDYLTIQDLKEIASAKREGIKTGYTFRNSQGKEEEFIIPSGGLTIVGGQSSHGKSRLLQNISLRIAEEEYNQGGEGIVLYFAFEETLLEVVTRYANIQVGIPHLSQYPSTSNSEVFRDYFQTGTLSKSPQGTRQEALPRLSSFVDRLYKEGRLRIYYSPELYSGDLCSLLEFLSTKYRIKAVFLDYLQAIYKEGYRKDRREELREICKDLNKTSKELDIPIVLSAQLNRDTPSPSEMSGSNIAESADITRYADTILLLWDSVKIRDLKDRDKYLNSQEYKLLQERGFTLGEPGKLYAVIDKNRGGTPDIDCILSYTPETGSIPSNEDLPGDTPGGLGLL